MEQPPLVDLRDSRARARESDRERDREREREIERTTDAHQQTKSGEQGGGKWELE